MKNFIKKLRVILLVISLIIVYKTAFSQIDYKMNIRVFGDYMTGKNLKGPAEITSEEFINKIGGGGGELGFFIKRNFNLYLNAR